MLARCARCQGTFSTDHFGLQTCPHCGAELMLADPNAPRGAAPGQPPSPPGATAPPEIAAGGEGRGEGGGMGAPPAAPPAPPSSAAPPSLPPVPPPPYGGYGPPPGGWPPPPPGGGWGPPPGGFGPELPAPFAERARLGWFTGFVETWKAAALAPAEFFRRVRIDQTGSAVLFAVIASTIGSWVQAVWNFLMSAGSVAQFEESLAKLPPEFSRYFEMMRPFVHEPTIAGFVGQLLVTPVFALIGTYLSAGVLHLFLMLFRGANRGFGATLTVVAYASAVNLLLVLPVCGWIVALVWWIVIVIAGLENAQRCGSGRAAAATFAPVVLLCLCCCGIGALGFGAAMRALGGLPSGGGGPVDL